jgi:hypothetical protein
MYGGGDGIVPALLTSAIDGSEWSASLPDHFTSEETALDTHCTGGCMGLGVGLDVVEESTYPCVNVNPTPGSPSKYPRLCRD